jgi:hypothetical protein
MRLFRKKARQLDKEVLIEIERHRSIQDSHKFYKRLNDVRRSFEPQVAMCRAKNGKLLTNKNSGSEGSELEQPTRPDLPSREKLEGALKYMKNNKAAGADSIAAVEKR